MTTTSKTRKLKDQSYRNKKALKPKLNHQQRKERSNITGKKYLTNLWYVV